MMPLFKEKPRNPMLLVHKDQPLEGAWSWEPLRASRPVFRLVRQNGLGALVGKFFENHPPAGPKDRGLLQEYANYRQAPSLGLPTGIIPRLMGPLPLPRLGLLLQAVEGYDLDYYLIQAVHQGNLEACVGCLERLAELLVLFHTRPKSRRAVEFAPARRYFLKLLSQLSNQGLLTADEQKFLEAECLAWETRFAAFSDFQVLLHGDATPTNFLFPDGQAVALDLERLRLGDRLFDLSWVAGELRHAWGWRGQEFPASEPAIQAFFQAYLAALSASAATADRIFALNPFYMALAELRIARNHYLSWDYRRSLVAEACRCLAYGRRWA